MNIYFWTLAASIGVYLIVGNYVGRKVKNIDDYYVAGRNAPTLLIVGTLVASFLSTNAFMGETGFGYAGYAFLMLALVAVNSSGYVIGALSFGRFIRRSKCLTVPEFFGKRFDSRALQALAGYTTILGIIAYLLAVTQGGSLLIANITGMPYGLALVIVWLGYMVFTMYSGSRGVIITDTIMFLLFVGISVLALPFVVGSTGGWHETITALAQFDAKPDILTWHGTTGPNGYWANATDAFIWAMILGVSWAIVIAVSPWQTSRYLMARSEHIVIRSACISGLVMACLYIILMILSAAINLANPDIKPNEEAILWAAQNMMPSFIGALLITGIMAAALSSCSTFLSLVGFSASYDVVDTRHWSDHKKLRISRYVMFGVAVISLLLAFFQPPAIMWITYFAGTLFAASWGPVAFLSIASKRITAPAAFVGMAVGFVVNVVSKLADKYEFISLPVYLDPIVLGFFSNLIAIILVSRITRPTADALEYLRKIRATPSSEMDAGELRKTMIWPLIVMAGGIAVGLFMYAFYSVPYARALGHEASLWRGETLMAVGYGLAIFLVGLLAYWQVRRIYGRPARDATTGAT